MAAGSKPAARASARAASSSSSFRCSLKPPVVPVPQAGNQEQERQQGLRILVADDNRDSADLFAMFLEMMGNEVQTAYDGVAAVEEAERFRPDAVLLDIGMPRLNGEDACRRIRSTPWGKDAVLIAVTGWDHEENRRRIVDAGFDAHLVKPVDPSSRRGPARVTIARATRRAHRGSDDGTWSSNRRPDRGSGYHGPLIRLRRTPGRRDVFHSVLDAGILAALARPHRPPASTPVVRSLPPVPADTAEHARKCLQTS